MANAAVILAGCVVAVNQDWTTGMGSSLRAGLASVPSTYEAAVILLVDQPFVTAEAVGDRGARDFLARHAVVSVPCDGSLADIGVPEDLALLRP